MLPYHRLSSKLIQRCHFFSLSFAQGAVERVHGAIETAFVFLISAIGGNLLSALFMPNSISVGASGGIFGLLGFCVADIVANWKLMTLRDDHGEHKFPYRPVFFWLGVDVLLTVIVGLTPFIDNFVSFSI